MDLVARLKRYMEHIGMPISQFADQAQIPRPTLSQILSGRNKKISNELLEKLHIAYPNLNISWLLFGDGPIDANPVQSMVQSSRQLESSVQAPKSPQVPDSTISNSISANVSSNFSTIGNNPMPTPDVSTTQDFTSESNPDNLFSSPTSSVSLTPNSTKKIEKIIVLYTDQSFEVFAPSPL